MEVWTISHHLTCGRISVILTNGCPKKRGQSQYHILTPFTLRYPVMPPELLVTTLTSLPLSLRKRHMSIYSFSPPPICGGKCGTIQVILIYTPWDSQRIRSWWGYYPEANNSYYVPKKQRIMTDPSFLASIRFRNKKKAERRVFYLRKEDSSLTLRMTNGLT